MGVFFLGLDRFKGVNDSYGHAQGDNVLRETAQRLRTAIDNGSVARSGGDDFLFAVPAESRDRVLRLGQDILAAMNRAFIVRDNGLHLGASIGLAFFPDDGREAESLMHRAELAMYGAKEKGGNSITAYTQSMGDTAARRMALETELYRAVDDETLTVHYQPKINISACDVAGCEALLRWQTNDGKWVPPPFFIPVAEDNGLVIRIDMYVLRSVCRQIHVWQDEGIAAVQSLSTCRLTIFFRKILLTM